jgi:hypothetical protein
LSLLLELLGNFHLRFPALTAAIVKQLNMPPTEFSQAELELLRARLQKFADKSERKATIKSAAKEVIKARGTSGRPEKKELQKVSKFPCYCEICLNYTIYDRK